MRSTSLFLRSPEPLHRACNPIGKGTWRGWGIEGMLDSHDKKDCINDPMYVSCHLNISVLYWNMLFSRNEDYTVLIEWHVLRQVFLTDLQCINIAKAAPPFENQKNNRIIQRNCLHTHTNHTFPAAQDSLSLTLTFCVMNYAAVVPYVYAAPLEWSELLGLEPTEMGFLNQVPWNLEMPGSLKPRNASARIVGRFWGDRWVWAYTRNESVHYLAGIYNLCLCLFPLSKRKRSMIEEIQVNQC